MYVIDLKMDDEAAEIILSALIIYLEMMREEDLSHDEELQADVNYTIKRAQETAEAISQTLNEDEAMH